MRLTVSLSRGLQQAFMCYVQDANYSQTALALENLTSLFLSFLGSLMDSFSILMFCNIT